MAKGQPAPAPAGTTTTGPETHFLGQQAAAKVSTTGGDTLVKVDQTPQSVDWKDVNGGGFGASSLGNPDVPAEAQDGTQQPDPKATEDAGEEKKPDPAAAAKVDKPKSDAKPDDAAKVEKPATEAKPDDPEKPAEAKKDDPPPKVPRPSRGEERKETMRALRLEAEARAANARAKAAEEKAAATEAALRAGTLEERLGRLGLSHAEIVEAVVTGTLPEPKTAAPAAAAAEPQTPAEVAELKKIVEETRAQLAAQQQQTALAHAVAQINSMEVPWVKETPGAIGQVINEAAEYYNKTGGKIDGQPVAWNDYVDSFARHKEAELRQAGPTAKSALEGHLARINRLLGAGDVAGAQAAVQVAAAATGQSATQVAAAATAKPAPRAPIGKRTGPKGAPDEDKYSLDPLERDRQIKAEMGWGD